MTIFERIDVLSSRTASDGRADAPVLECPACLDSGWVEHICTGFDCGRLRRHGRHTYVTACECRPMNRTFQERQQRSRRSAA